MAKAGVFGVFCSWAGVRLSLTEDACGVLATLAGDSTFCLAAGEASAGRFFAGVLWCFPSDFISILTALLQRTCGR